MKHFTSFFSAVSRLAGASTAMALGISAHTHAAPGDLDSSFGSGFGKVLYPVTAQYDVAVASRRLPDGKRLIVGTCDTTPVTTTDRYAACSMRLNEDGSIDTTYGVNGRAIAAYPVANSDVLPSSRDILLDATNRATFIGVCNDSSVPVVNALCIGRLNADGSLDSSFGNGGFALASFPAYYIQPTRLFRVADDKLLVSTFCSVANSSAQTAFCSIRFNANGSIDTSYGTGGIHVTFLMLRSESVDAALLPDGKLLMGGRCRANEINPTPYQFCLLRVLANGIVDTSFGTSGQVFTIVSSNPTPFAAPPYLSVHPDGTITLISHRCEPTSPETKQYCMVRYSTNGTVIPTQGVNVYRLPYFPGILPRFFLTGVAPQADGKYLLYGQCNDDNGTISDFCVIRLHPDGLLDPSFAGVGYLQTSISVNNTLGSKDRPAAAELESDGRFTVVGTCLGSSGIDESEASDFCAARYELGPFNGSYCTLDIDGDGNLNAATDGLINLRVMLGMTGNAVVQDVPFLSNAKRTSWTSVRKYLTEQCGMTLGI